MQSLATSILAPAASRQAQWPLLLPVLLMLLVPLLLLLSPSLQPAYFAAVATAMPRRRCMPFTVCHICPLAQWALLVWHCDGTAGGDGCVVPRGAPPSQRLARGGGSGTLTVGLILLAAASI